MTTKKHHGKYKVIEHGRINDYVVIACSIAGFLVGYAVDSTLIGFFSTGCFVLSALRIITDRRSKSWILSA